ncbi:recombination mediator RecR [Paracoccus seriniphilus]|uniref:Recombination protein RecR n=1 Tax=Paracoccus seriniphilus TaxID=184748 RepID=A0A239PXE2_9RHOB|nr:recombination mediator RecR [Paracoccus seriniphilus]WCR13060.1 recombination protein RecR [Paracoccus seriniphilus]SNT74758.1 DNA replication and repair protein RecR [Paracoccus seriniphilus]
MAEGSDDIQALITLMGRLPGLGPRSARRIVLQLIRKRSGQMTQLAQLLDRVATNSRECLTCGNITDSDQCAICSDPRRDTGEICVVEDVADLWALERGNSFRGRYHVLGGTLSALDEIGPEDLGIPALLERIENQNVREVILALNATVDGQTTAHYIADILNDMGVAVTGLAHGVPIGGELDYLDDGTISAALNARRKL